MKPKKYHYVYEITYSTGKKYIGVRSCNCEIEDDNYLGSGFHIPPEVKGTETKKVLSTHNTREEAMVEEIRLHALFDVKNNPDYYNQCNSTSTKFQVSEEAHKRSAETRKGRTKETHEYIQKQVEAHSKYKGENRTEAQKQSFSPDRMPERIRKYKESLQKSMEDPEFAKRIKEARIRGGKSCKGIPNPKKGHTGINHPRVKPWWFTHPVLGTVQVYDSIRDYHKQHNDTFPFSSSSIMRFLRDSKVPNKLLQLGWDFGYIQTDSSNDAT